ncbi:unnamed protein product, partial [Symbiodinium microadriaticum]
SCELQPVLEDGIMLLPPVFPRCFKLYCFGWRSDSSWTTLSNLGWRRPTWISFTVSFP